jgi:hypothetical protein
MSLLSKVNEHRTNHFHPRRPNSPFGPWLQMRKLAHSTALAFKVAESRLVPALTVCHFEPRKWHTLPTVAQTRPSCRSSTTLASVNGSLTAQACSIPAPDTVAIW